MDFIELAKNRYSCKNFSDKVVDRDSLGAILEAGRLAPTAQNRQGQHIYVVESKEGLSKIDKLTPCRYNAQTALLVAFDRNNTDTYPGGKYNSGVEDASIVATHMVLAAQSLGVDSCFVNIFDPDKLAEEFSLPANEQVVAIIDLGYKADGVKPLAKHFERKDLDELVSFI